MRLTPRERSALLIIYNRGFADLRKVSEQYRQGLIDLGMREPPLIEVDADRVTLTDAGRQAASRS